MVTGRALERFRAEGAPFRHLLVQHHDRIADAHAGVHQFPVLARHSGEFGGAERLLVEFDRLGRAGADQMRCYRMHSLRDRFHRGLRPAIFFHGLIHGCFVFLGSFGLRSKIRRMESSHPDAEREIGPE